MPMVLCIPIDVKNKKTDFCVGLFSIYNLVAVYLHRFLANTVSLYDGVEKTSNVHRRGRRPDAPKSYNQYERLTGGHGDPPLRWGLHTNLWFIVGEGSTLPKTLQKDKTPPLR